jgi:DNA-binding MarR family transcriptional regulator
MSRSPNRAPSTVDPKGEFPLDLTTYVFHLFTVTTRHRDARLETLLRPLGLNLPRHRALSTIAAQEPCTMTELAEFSAVDRTTLTRTIDQLVEAGLVARSTPPEDRRQVVLTLTEEGRAACRGSLRAIYRLNRRLLDGVEENDQRALARIFERFLGRLELAPALLDRVLLRDLQPPK